MVELQIRFPSHTLLAEQRSLILSSFVQMLRMPITFWPIASRHLTLSKKCDDFWLSGTESFPTIYGINHFAANFFSRYYTLSGGSHDESPSQLNTCKSQIFSVKNPNLQSSGLAAKSSVVKTRQFWILLSSHLRFWVLFNFLSSLIFGLPKTRLPPIRVGCFGAWKLCLGEMHLCNAYSGSGVSQLADVMESESNNYFFAYMHNGHYRSQVIKWICMKDVYKICLEHLQVIFDKQMKNLAIFQNR